MTNVVNFLKSANATLQTQKQPDMHRITNIKYNNKSSKSQRSIHGYNTNSVRCSKRILDQISRTKLNVVLVYSVFFCGFITIVFNFNLFLLLLFCLNQESQIILYLSYLCYSSHKIYNLTYNSSPNKENKKLISEYQFHKNKITHT